MAKRKSLLEQAYTELPAVKSRHSRKPWHVRLRESDPALYQQICECIQDYKNSNTPAYWKSLEDLWKWLKFTKKIPLQCEPSTFMEFARKLHNGEFEENWEDQQAAS